MNDLIFKTGAAFFCTVIAITIISFIIKFVKEVRKEQNDKNKRKI
jgi:hypothetical protein